MCIWQTKLLSYETSNAVSDEKYSRQYSCFFDYFCALPEKYHNNKKYNSLEKHLEERIWKVGGSIDHQGKWSTIRGISREFPVYPVADTTETESYRDDDC
jgi:hypothetical protein